MRISDWSSDVCSSDLLSECWRLADRIMLALTPKDKSLQDCKIAVQRLKYQRSSGDFDRLAAMTGNALGRWGRLGAAIDVCRSKTAGPFRRKRSEEHTYELQSLMRSSYAVLCFKK